MECLAASFHSFEVLLCLPENCELVKISNGPPMANFAALYRSF